MYNELYKAWKSERTSDTPQPLSGDFYKRAYGYLKGMEADTSSTDEHSLQGRLLTKELEMAKRLLKELKESRLKKIISTARNGAEINPQHLTDEERTVVESISGSISAFNSEREDKQKEEPQSATEAETALAVVRFLQDIPEIVGVDLKIYGPYKKEDVGSLPKQNALGLVKQGAAKLVEVEGIA